MLRLRPALRGRQLPAVPAYLILEGVGAFAFTLIVTVNLVYQAQTVGLSPLQLVLVGTLLEVVCFLGEVPTGIVADVYSRRLSVIIGTILIGAGFIIEGSLPLFAGVLLAQVVWGIGATFTSGATQAWIADEVGEERVGAVYLRAAQINQLAGLLGLGASVALATWRLNVPVVAGGALFVLLGLVAIVIMPETGFQPTPRGERTTFQAMGATLREGAGVVRGRPVLISILGIGAFFGMFSEGFDRLSTVHLLDSVGLPPIGDLDPVVWFGIIGVVGMLLSISVTEVLRRRVDTASHREVGRALLVLNLTLTGSVIVFGLAGNLFLALGALWMAGVVRSVNGPLYAAWLNQNIPSRVRATVLSMANQVDAAGQIGGGPILGWIGSAFSLRAAMVAAALALTPALPLFARAARQGRVAEELSLATEP